jgi:hypothetical protein
VSRLCPALLYLELVMKKPLLLAALAFASPLALGISARAEANTYSPAGSDDPNMTGQTQRMFIINAATPGALTFSGAGTATFNNAVGTSNQFNVGSNTSIGVTSSLSATPEITGQALANMQVAAGSNLMQTNGTASQAASAQAASVAAQEVASSQAYKQAHSQGWESAVQYIARTQYAGDAQASAKAEADLAGMGSYSASGQWEWSANSSVSTAAKAVYSNTYNQEYNNAYTTAYSNVISSTNENSSSQSATGVIKGSFTSVEDSVSAIGQSGSLAAVTTSALAAADRVGTRFLTQDGVQVENQAWRQAFNAAYSAGYQNAVGNVKSTSTSNVAIEGLGAIASVNSDPASKFVVDLSRLENIEQQNATATANGSANSTLSTNSFATQNNQRTASAFMQAFAQ